MSDNKPVPPLPEGVLSDDLLQKIGGGECTVSDYITALQNLKDNYDTLVDFTSYVLDRVANSVP
jgi:hypothetical protein